MVLWDLHNPILPGKGGFISERFSIRFESQKKVPNQLPEHYPFEEKMIKRVICNLFWEI